MQRPVFPGVGAQLEVVDVVARRQHPRFELRILVDDGLSEVWDGVYVVDDFDRQFHQAKALRGVFKRSDAAVRELQWAEETCLGVAQCFELLCLKVESKEIRSARDIGRTQQIAPIR